MHNEGSSRGYHSSDHFGEHLYAHGGQRYTFEVAKTANKVEIAQAVEAIFDVKVVKVNTANVKSKPKRVRFQAGSTRTWKKAMVTLAEGESIEIFAAQD